MSGVDNRGRVFDDELGMWLAPMTINGELVTGHPLLKVLPDLESDHGILVDFIELALGEAPDTERVGRALKLVEPQLCAWHREHAEKVTEMCGLVSAEPRLLDHPWTARERAALELRELLEAGDVGRLRRLQALAEVA